MPEGRETVDDRIRGDFFEKLWQGSNVGGGSRPFSDALQYVENHLVPLGQPQAQGLSFLRAIGGQKNAYDPIIKSVLEFRSLCGSVDDVIRAIEAIALYNKFGGFTGSMVRERKV